jgi:hypothetical protein
MTMPSLGITIEWNKSALVVVNGLPAASGKMNRLPGSALRKKGTEGITSTWTIQKATTMTSALAMICMAARDERATIGTITPETQFVVVTLNDAADAAT